MPTSISPQDFVARWRNSTLKERSASQSHFNDLCHLVGHPAPTEADLHGTTFCFEAGASKQSGGQGWADVWKKEYFAWEYKGKQADLDKAYRQLLLYREALENPPLLVVSDFEQIIIHTNFTNTVKRVYNIFFRTAFTDVQYRKSYPFFTPVFYTPSSQRNKPRA